MLIIKLNIVAMSTSYHTVSPVLMIVFNRPDTAEQVLEKVRKARPAKLYVAADGPRTDRPGEGALCGRVRALFDNPGWPCEVKTLYRESNLGCRSAVSSAIDWFFDQESEGIILEDDCLPAASFFKFADTMLEKYRYDTRIRHICGVNLQFGQKWGESSYYFSNLTHVWGWASWRRVWQDYDVNMSRYHEDEVRPQLSNVFTDPFILDSWADIFKKVRSGEIDTWDYQLTFTNFFHNGLAVTPNQNLISNIGFGAASTHTPDAGSPYARIPLEELNGEITHPTYFLPQKQADFNVLAYDFELKRRYRKYNKFHRRLKRWLKGK